MFRSDLHQTRLHVDRLSEENDMLRRRLEGERPKPKSRVGFSIGVALGSVVACLAIGAGALKTYSYLSNRHAPVITDLAPIDNPSASLPIDGIETKILQRGSGEVAQRGQHVRVSYEGQLMDGTVFDKTEGRGAFDFVLGERKVIPGFDQGVTGMQVGERRKVTIPPNLAYGDRGTGPIPKRATLVFVIELLSVDGSAQPDQGLDPRDPGLDIRSK